MAFSPSCLIAILPDDVVLYAVIAVHGDSQPPMCCIYN